MEEGKVRVVESLGVDRQTFVDSDLQSLIAEAGSQEERLSRGGQSVYVAGVRCL